MVKSYMKLNGNLTPISVGTVGAIPKEEETKTVSSPNFSSGNIVVTPTTGKVMTQVTVIKDNDLVPEKIIKDVNIFGVVGTAEPVKEEQTKTVTSPNFSSGNFIEVTPDAGKVLTKVTVVKSSYLVPENIVKDVNIFGVVGTAETGGGLGAGVTVTISKFNDLSATETYWIRTIEDGVAKDYGVHYNYNQLNLTLYKVQYICIYCDYREISSGIISYDTLTGATGAELENGLVPTGNINLFEYMKD